jgi:Protein of unknown function (DUF3667)
MSKNPLRKEKNCLNCNQIVELRFCPNCGQENTDTRKTFHHLFVHFFEDLTHYENAFWKTIKNLILKPSTLTTEYLSGKRLSYLAPVRLYIFISFITFFLITIFPKKDLEVGVNNTNETKKEYHIDKEKNKFFDIGVNSIKELDSIQKNAALENKMSEFEYWVKKKMVLVKNGKTDREIIDKFLESFSHNFPKTLFIYMPLFAFVLWLFNDKKKWYYFDHGIFTLHYFSFLLLINLLLFLFKHFVDLFVENSFVNFISGTVNFISVFWMLYYFFPAYHRFYKQSRFISVIKISLISTINFIIFISLLLLFAFYTFINLA